MHRLSQVATLSSATLLPRQAVLVAAQQPRQHMSTVRASISRMLMSTNQSRIVDIAHDKELKRGLKTNGEKSDYVESSNNTVGEHVQDSTSVVTDVAKDATNRLNNSAKRATVRMEQDMGDAKDSAKSMGERAKKQAKDTADRASSVVDRTADKALNVAERVDNKMQDMSQETKKAMGDAKSSASELASREGDHSQTMQEPSKQAMGGAQSTKKDDVKQSMKKVGNTTSRTGISQADKENPDSIQRENAAGRMQGMSYNAADTAQGVSDRARGQLDSTQGQARAEDWDVAAKVMRDSEATGGTNKDKGVDEQHIQPGTRNLRGTDDNFDNDPAVSIDDMQSKIRETKDKITGGADHVMESLGQSMRQTTQNVKEAVKGVTAPIRETVMGAATKAKEVVTGERESEKPDMDKGVVRTKEGDFPPGTKPKDIEKDKQGGPWQ